MAFDTQLAGRLRKALARRSDVAEKQMFGGLAFMVANRMTVGVLGNDMIVKVGKEGHDDAVAQPHARPMDFTGRPMRGMVYVAPDGTATGTAVRAWVKRAITYIEAQPPKAAKVAKGKKAAKPKAKSAKAKPVKLLSGGNPQIAKSEGNAPVQAYIAAMPGWKRKVGRRVDAVIVRAAPTVRKAVRWNSPFYGIEGQGWFLAMHTFTYYVKVVFFRGKSLQPVPPGPSKSKQAGYLNIREDDTFDEAQFAKWVKQAAKLPGWLA